MFGRISSITRNARQFSTSMARYHGRPGLPGENFPMNFDGGKYKITLLHIIFFGIPLGAPWFVVQWSLIKGT